MEASIYFWGKSCESFYSWRKRQNPPTCYRGIQHESFTPFLCKPQSHKYYNDCHTIHINYRQRFCLEEWISDCRYRIALIEELISITETDLWEFQQKISHYRYRFSLKFQFTIAAKIITKKTLYKEKIEAINFIKITNSRFTKQIAWLVFLQKGTHQWQQHYKENLLVELFL